MKAWFTQLNQREQMSLLVLGFALALYLLYMLVWSPLDSRRQSLATQNEGVAGSLQRVDAMVSELMHLRDSGMQAGPRRNVTSLVSQSTSRLQLQVSRLQPNSRGEIQVRLEKCGLRRSAVCGCTRWNTGKACWCAKCRSPRPVQ